jgi:hypothetical protein
VSADLDCHEVVAVFFFAKVEFGVVELVWCMLSPVGCTSCVQICSCCWEKKLLEFIFFEVFLLPLPSWFLIIQLQRRANLVSDCRFVWKTNLNRWKHKNIHWCLHSKQILLQSTSTKTPCGKQILLQILVNLVLLVWGCSLLSLFICVVFSHT